MNTFGLSDRFKIKMKNELKQKLFNKGLLEINHRYKNMLKNLAVPQNQDAETSENGRKISVAADNVSKRYKKVFKKLAD